MTMKTTVALLLLIGFVFIFADSGILHKLKKRQIGGITRRPFIRNGTVVPFLRPDRNATLDDNTGKTNDTSKKTPSIGTFGYGGGYGGGYGYYDPCSPYYAFCCNPYDPYCTYCCNSYYG